MMLDIPKKVKPAKWVSSDNIALGTTLKPIPKFDESMLLPDRFTHNNPKLQVSQEIRNKLIVLSDKIHQEEAKLRSLPGARKVKLEDLIEFITIRHGFTSIITDVIYSLEDFDLDEQLAKVDEVSKKAKVLLSRQ